LGLAAEYTLASLLVQAIFSWLIALLLGYFSRKVPRVYLADWSRAWWAYGLGQLGAASALYSGVAGTSFPLSRFVSTWVSQLGAYWHAAWLLFGVFSLAVLWTPTKRGRQVILGGLALVAFAASLAYGEDPSAVAARLFVRVSVRAFSIGASLAVAGVLLFYHTRKAGSAGSRITAVALGLAAVHQGVVGAEAAGWLGGVWRTWVGYGDVAMIGFVGLASVIWLLEEEQQRLMAAAYEIDRLAYFDVVTGLPNRRLLLERLRDAVERGHATRGTFALFVLDIDDFKRINDSLGHEAGDRLLIAMAQRLKQVVREGDTLARVGGDEFAFLVSGIGSEQQALELSERIREAFLSPFQLEDRSLYVSSSLGISLFPRHGEDPMGLLRKADTAMHQAKETPRQRFVVYDDKMSSWTRERLIFDHALRKGELLAQLELYYQPVVTAGSGAIVGVEALLRWRHPERGLLTPSSFLALAEACGASEDISRWVLERALQDLAEWRSRFRTDWRVAINLTARTFEAPELLEQVQSALERTQLPPSVLELEITETMALLSGGQAIETLRALRAIGVRIAVDDFGTGYSSLSYLRELPLDTLKLDASFVRELGRRPEDSRIVGAVIQLAHGLGLEVVAEGVEREEQMAILGMLSCDRMQGFLFSKPTPKAELETIIEASVHFQSVRAPSRDRHAR
jgi:diguanylate cyclase (GGDEF)-like protein